MIIFLVLFCASGFGAYCCFPRPLYVCILLPRNVVVTVVQGRFKPFCFKITGRCTRRVEIW
ncbi:unnamed protein product [Pylaiella littoralis]